VRIIFSAKSERDDKGQTKKRQQGFPDPYTILQFANKNISKKEISTTPQFIIVPSSLF
jgi:hypothetical protein